MGWEYVGGCNIARGAEGDNNQNKFGQSRRSPGRSSYSRYHCSPSFFRPPDSPVPYVVAMASARAPPINSDVKLIPENHLKPLRVQKGSLGAKVRLNKEFCPEIAVMSELAKGKLPGSRLQFNSPDLFPEVREEESGQLQELQFQGPASLLNPYSSRRVHAPSVPWRYLQRSFETPPCSPRRNTHPNQQQQNVEGVDGNLHRDSVRSTRDAQCQTLCDAGVQTEKTKSKKMHGNHGDGSKCEDALSFETSSSDVSLVSLGIHVDVADSEECGRGKRVSSKARASPRLRRRKSAVGKKEEEERGGRSASTDSSKGKTGTIGKAVVKNKKRKKKKSAKRAGSGSKKSGSGEEGSPVDVTAIHNRRPPPEISESSGTASASTSRRNSSPDLHSDFADRSLNPKSAKSNQYEPPRSSHPSKQGDFFSTSRMLAHAPTEFGATSSGSHEQTGSKREGGSDTVGVGKHAKSEPFGSSVHTSQSGFGGTECLSSTHVLGNQREHLALSFPTPPVSNVPNETILGGTNHPESARDVLELAPRISFPTCGLAPSTSTPRQGYGTDTEKTPIPMPFPSPSIFTIQHMNRTNKEQGKTQEEGRNSLESLAELERLIEEQHMQLVARGILQADDDVMESSVDDVPNPDAETLDKHVNSVRKVAFDPNRKTEFSDQKHSSDGTSNSEFLRSQSKGGAVRQTGEHQSQKSPEVRDLEAELSRNLEELLDGNSGDPGVNARAARDVNLNASRDLPASSSGHTHAHRQDNGTSITSFLVDDQSESDLSESLINLLEKDPEAETGCFNLGNPLHTERVSRHKATSSTSRKSVEEDDSLHCLRRGCQYDCSCSYSLNEDSVEGSSHFAGMVASVAAVAMRSDLEERELVQDPGVFNVDVIRQ